MIGDRALEFLPAQAWAFSLVFLPLLGAALALFSKAFFSDDRYARAKWFGEYLAGVVGLALPWISMVALLPSLWEGAAWEGIIGGWNYQVGIAYRFDGLAWMVNLLGFAVAGAAWIYTRGKGPKGPGFTAVFLIQTAALAATSMTADLFNLFVCLEVMGIASYILIASSDKPGAFLAAFSYLMVSATAMVFFLVGFFGLYRLTGSLSYQGVAQALASLPQSGGVTAQVSIALIAAAVAIRVAVMPVYGWLPDSHALAPHGVSAVLSGVLIKTPLFALTRVLQIIPAGSPAGELLSYAGAFTAIMAVTIALAQSDAKRLLAYHTVSQIGYVVTAWGAAVAVGPTTAAGGLLLAASFLHALYHALFKGLLFLTVGTTVDGGGDRDVYTLRGGARILKNQGERFPWTLIGFMVGALAITAIPPFNGFASKAALSYGLKGTLQYQLLFLASIGTVASFIKLSRIYWPQRAMKLLDPSEISKKVSSQESSIPSTINSAIKSATDPSTDGIADPSADLVSQEKTYEPVVEEIVQDLGEVPREIQEELSHEENLPVKTPMSVKIAQGILTLGCIGTGIFAPQMYRLTRNLFAPGAGVHWDQIPRLSGEESSVALGMSVATEQQVSIPLPQTWPEIPLYSWDVLQNTLVVVGFGVLVFFLATSKVGGTLLHAVRHRPRSFHGLFSAFALGAGALALWMIL
jgi:formate hydrogenlyase subunit 3/multisubunit Na+/H+ antiporter MnhD subunit